MKTRTTIETLSSSINIYYRDTIIALGSCFATEVGGTLRDHDFDCIVNPYGVVYNPVSLANQVRLVLSKDQVNPEHFVMRDGKQAHLDFHSKLIANDLSSYQRELDTIKETFLESVKKAKILLLTLGTAFVFEYTKTGKIITNCHKVPGYEFNRKLLSTVTIYAKLKQLMDSLLSVNPDMHFICTVSPIRHIRDTLSGNARSKAALLVALHNIVDHHSNCDYFPSYEIMLDDLRDYRYYKDDFIHPTPKALNYIWDQFQKTYMEEETVTKMKAVEKKKKRESHRPIIE